MPSPGPSHLRKRSSTTSISSLVAHGGQSKRKHTVVAGLDDPLACHSPRSPPHVSLYADDEIRPRRRSRVVVNICLSTLFLCILMVAFFSDPTAVKSRMPSHLTMLADSLSLSLFDASDPLLPSTRPPPKSESMFDDDSAAVGDVVVEGGEWAQTLYDALDPVCSTGQERASASLTRMYDGPPLPRTAFASFPRSGNSYIRALVERSTGYRTTSIYCDRSLAATFLGECDRGPGSNFFKKTHYPALQGRSKPELEALAMDFDRAVQVVRNPIDALYSYWTFEEVRTMKLRPDQNKHTLHLNVTLGETAEQREQVLALADRWNMFHDVWSQAALPKLQLRYEDLRAAPLPQLLQLVSFLLPPTSLPPLSDIACALTLDESRQAYKSSKSLPFTSWDFYTPALREEVIEKTSRWWCEFGYDRALQQARGTLGNLNCTDVMRQGLKINNPVKKSKSRKFHV